MNTIDLNSLLTGQTSNGAWSTTSACGDTATNPDTIDLTNPASVDFTGKQAGIYTFYYSIDLPNCPVDCTSVTIQAVDSCLLAISNVTVSSGCPYNLSVHYTVTNVKDKLDLNIANSTGVVLRQELNQEMTVPGTHTVTVEGVPCTSTTEEWTAALCCKK